MPPIQVADARQRCPLPAITITPTVSARTGGTTVSFVPSASPAARPPTIRAPRGSVAVEATDLPPGQRLLTSRATAERKRAIATTSLLALPGWREKRRFAAITEARAASEVAPEP